jgi:hypothetical protein
MTSRGAHSTDLDDALAKGGEIAPYEHPDLPLGVPW